MTRRVLLVDDEALARDRLRDLLGELEGVEVVGECDSGETAIEAVARLTPDILLLDVQMPGLGGFDVVEALTGTTEPGAMPVIIFVTAYDQYAVRAFEACALDYVQKPVLRPRLAQSIDRAIQQVALRDTARANARPGAGAAAAARLDALNAATRSTRGYATRLAVRHRDTVRFVRPEEVDWIDVTGNYLRLHVRGTTHLLRGTIADLERRLDPQHFARVHRSAIANLDRITKVEPFTRGEYVIVMADGARLRSSRAHSARLRQLIRSGVE